MHQIHEAIINQCQDASRIAEQARAAQAEQQRTQDRDLVNAQDKTTGRVPIMYAIEHDDLSAARILLQNGARIDITDQEGNDVSDFATMHGSTEMFDLIIDHSMSLDDGLAAIPPHI